MASNPDFAIEASYTQQRIPQYRGNPFIEALPPSLDDDELLKFMFNVPDFAEHQREWTKSERLQMVLELSSFMVPMDRHLHLAQNIDTMIRRGYVGREPRTPESMMVLRKIYELQKAGKSFDSSSVKSSGQLSSALIGIPGMGKTTTIRRLLARMTPVIFHPKYGIYQIPYLHIEMPYDGASVKGIAQTIFRKVDALLPDVNYGMQYGNNRSGAETLMNHAARIMHMHAVGILVVDELENLENSPKNRQSLMTLLVSATNQLGLPLMFLGTNQAENLLSIDLRLARRSIGIASTYWETFKKGSSAEPGEWDDFLSVLWHFQWVKNPVPLSPQLSDLMFHHTQGVADIAIKLFAVAQAHAMHDKTETLTGALIESVAQKELARVLPMIEAIRRKDVSALVAYRDITPMGLGSLLANIGTKFSGYQVQGATIAGNNPMFTPAVTEALITVGFELQDAQTLAKNVSGSSNVLVGVQKALLHATSGTAVKPKKPTIAAEPTTYPPGDYRNALSPEHEGATVLERLKFLRLITGIDALLTI